MRGKKEWQWRNKEKSNHSLLKKGRMTPKDAYFPEVKIFYVFWLSDPLDLICCKNNCASACPVPYLHRRAHLILQRCCSTVSAWLDLAEVVGSTSWPHLLNFQPLVWTNVSLAPYIRRKKAGWDQTSWKDTKARWDHETGDFHQDWV